MAGMLVILGIMISSCGNMKVQDTKSEMTQATAAQENTADEGKNEKNVLYEGMLSNPEVLQQKNTYTALNVATYITKIDNTYFIADCYHNQIIYHDNLTDPLNQWNVLTDEVHYAHTIASDGTIFLVDDTENNRLMVFQKTEDGYAHTQTLEKIGMKPHYVQYDAENEVFMAWSSITGEMYLLKRASEADENGIYPVFVEKVLKLDELFGVYVRSFTIMEDGIYFVSGHNNQKIIKAIISSSGDGFDIIAQYDVTDEIAGMVQLTKIGDFYYITVSTDNQENQDFATIIRTDRLEKLSDGRYEDIYDKFGAGGGTPYYITQIEGRYYMAHHRTDENIIAFDVNNNMIENVQVIY